MTVPTQAVPPQTVVISYWLYIVGAVLGLIGLVVGLAVLPSTLAQLQDQLSRSGSATGAGGVVAGAAIGGAVLSSVLSVAFAVVMIVFARKMRAGRNWARIVLAVLAGLQIFGVLGAYGVGAVHFLVLLAALILSFLAPSNAYFRSFSAQAPAAY